ncbi:MAG: hypothetical protein HYX38_26735 [Rhodospirillales bacterium]|nr:hypothetical protein [Rhodospirillales bacterium]
MPSTMTSFRRIEVDGPRYSDHTRLWYASLDLARPKKDISPDAVVLNHAIRVLVQGAEAPAARIRDQADVHFHEPRLLAAAAGADHVRRDGEQGPEARILDARFAPVTLANDAEWRRYSELRVVPQSSWPPASGFDRDPGTNKFEPAAPPFRARSGVIHVGLARFDEIDSNGVARILRVDWSGTGPVGLFGGMRVPRRRTVPIEGKVHDAIAFDLTPTGIEFPEVEVLNPFATSADDFLTLRLRLVAVQRRNFTELRLDLVGASTPATLKCLADGLDFRARDLRVRGGAIGLQIDTRGVPPLSWRLRGNLSEGFRCAPAGRVPSAWIREEGVAIKILTRPDLTGDEPGVAELLHHRGEFLERAPQEPLTLQLGPVEDQPAPPTGATVELTWPVAAARPGPEPVPPTEIALSNLSGIVAIDGVAARLRDIWSRSGALPADATVPYAFLALERGWLQLPIPAEKKSTAAPAATAAPATFLGFMRVDLNPDDRERAPGLMLTAAAKVDLTITWASPAEPASPRTIELVLHNASGILDGALWAGEASPTPVEILPPLDAGPAALTSLPIRFGPGAIDERGWPTQVPSISQNGLGEIKIALPLPATESDPPLLGWIAHEQLALVASVAMTRTAESATRPSATRELMPVEIMRNASGPLRLAFAGGTRLPRLSLGSPGNEHGVTMQGDGRWNWPWPTLHAAGPGTDAASPEEAAGVALASLTLPGVEFTVTTEAQAQPTPDLRVSLRYDLPILDELFANAKAPEPKGAAAPRGEAVARPTALEPQRLAEHWRENARRLARARTHADRVVMRQDNTGITLWHALTATTGVTVPGLVEPYTWRPTKFEMVANRPQSNISLGAYRFDDTVWYAGATTRSGIASALAGLNGRFNVDAGTATLAVDANGPISVDGFAVSSFRTPSGQPGAGQLHDGRGLSLAAEGEANGSVTRRAFTLRPGGNAAPPAGRFLATGTRPFNLQIGTTQARFTYRDLPVEMVGAAMKFVPDGGLETATGPDPGALDRARLPHALYEWRLWDNGSPNSFELLVAGPLALRPLRLLAAELDAQGEPTSLEIVAAVGLTATAAGGQQDRMPFIGADDNATGNLVLLKFTPVGGQLRLSALERRRFSPEPTPSFAASSEPLHFHASVAVSAAGRQSGSSEGTLDITLGIDGALKLDSAALRIQLFGQDCNLVAASTQISATAITATFKAPSIPSGALALEELELSWRAGALPTLEIKRGFLTLALRDNDPQSPTVLRRDFENGTLQWLGLTNIAVGQETVDHATGVVQIGIAHMLQESTALFRGFHLPTGSLNGMLATVLASEPTATEAWPARKLGPTIAELAFDRSPTDTAARVTAIRHRHLSTPQKPGLPPQITSVLRLDAAFGAERSTIEWPAGRVSVSPSQQRFDPDPADRDSWSPTLSMAGNGRVLVHDVRPRLSAHELPLDCLRVRGNEVELAQPWRFRAVVEHILTVRADTGDALGTPLAWTSIDELCLVDLQCLGEAAALDAQGPTANEAYAFMARYKENEPHREEVRIAGVVRRTLAEAGFPSRLILDAVRSAAPSAAALVLAGAAVLEVRLPGGDGYDRGVTLVPHWILPWSAGGDLAGLAHCPQSDGSYRIAAYDAASGLPRRLDGATASAFASQDGTESLLQDRLEALAGAPIGRLIVADQAFFVPLDPQVSPRDRVLFPRTLLAMQTVVAAFSDAPGLRFADRVACVLPAPSGGQLRFAVNAWPPDAQEPKASPQMTLIVADDSRLWLQALPSALTETLIDPVGQGIAASGAQRADAARRSLSLTARPRFVMLARVDSAYLTIRSAKTAPSIAPHVAWQRVHLPEPPMVQRRARLLRKREDTAYASPALGWPADDRDTAIAAAQAKLGDEEVRRNEQRAWAGRVRSLAWPTLALAGDAEHEFGHAAFLSFGQRIAFRRRAAATMTAPPDRLATLTTARPRAPTADALESALATARLADGGNDRPALAPMLPGPIEVTTTGMRPGVLLTQHDSLLQAMMPEAAFDADFDRFGRPAARGAVIARQVRAPRSAALPELRDLAVRRKTFIAGDEKQDGERLKPFKLIRGPSTVVRFDRSGAGDNPFSLTLTVVDPESGWLRADWKGPLKLRTRVPSGQASAAIALARIGILPVSGDTRRNIIAELLVGDCTLSFARLSWQTEGNDVVLVLDNARSAGTVPIAQALRDASADTLVRFSIRCGRPLKADEPDPQVALTGVTAIGEQGTRLLPGPPRVLVFDLPHVPTQRRWLARSSLTLGFGDPAYDRELGSPAMSNQRAIDDVRYALAADRVDYDPGAIVHFAGWGGTDAWDVKLVLQVVPRDGSRARSLAIADIPSVGTDPEKPSYAIEREMAYALPLSSLLEVPATDKRPARLKPGDRLKLQLEITGKPQEGPSIYLGIVAEPALPPPAACYGLATLPGGPGSTAVSAALFATAPLPTTIDFPDLVGDLVLGHVRRRALFLWSLAVPSLPAAGVPYAFLLKYDRSGGGQVPSDRTDFLPMEF